MDTESPVEASNEIQSSCINKCVNTDPVNNFMEKVLRADDSCFYYTGIPNVNLLKYLFEWVLPAARLIKLWDGKRRHIPGRVEHGQGIPCLRK
jgi:hypothetical protein